MFADMTARAPLCILACGDAAGLGLAVANELGVAAAASHDVWFASGEGKHVLDANVRGTDVYLFQRTLVPGSLRSVYDRFTMLLHAADAARHADADRVTVVLPYLPGCRQDKRKGRTREGVTTGLFARMLEAAGVSMVITVEPHTEAVVGCYEPSRCVFESVQLAPSFAHWFQALGLQDYVVASTDVGGLENARQYAQILGTGLVALSKERDYSQPNTVAATTVIGDPAGRDVLIVDDIVDTGGSVVAAATALWDAGARNIAVAGVHMLMSGPAWKRMASLRELASQRGVDFQLLGTSSVLHPQAPDWYRSMPLEPLLAKVVRSVNTRGSVRGVVEQG